MSPDELPAVPICKAAVLRGGSDVTIVARSRLAHDALVSAPLEDAYVPGVDEIVAAVLGPPEMILTRRPKERSHA